MFLPQLWSHLIAWTSIHAVSPALLILHIGKSAGSPEEIAEALLIAVLQIGIIAMIFRPLESFVPAEKWQDRSLTRLDRQYTLLMLLGLFPLFSYLVLMPFSNLFAGAADVGNEATSFGLKHWLPWFDHHPLLLFFVYYIAYDFVYYWMHRTQHAIPWWWALHSMHHSQRQMSCWTNDRGNYLDGMLQSMVLATVGLAMGVEPSEFAFLMLVGELAQNFSHANVRIGFGHVMEKFFVDPKFHRLHHMRVDLDRPNLHNCNFGQVFSIWDVLFGTALYGEKPRPTGVGDPMVDIDNERSLIPQQWGALKRFWGAFTCTAGWKLGDVSFGADHRPIPSSHTDLHALQSPAADAFAPSVSPK